MAKGLQRKPAAQLTGQPFTIGIRESNQRKFTGRLNCKMSLFSGGTSQTLKKHPGLNPTVIKMLTSKLDDLPALRTAVRANIYWSWIHIDTEKPPAPDRVDDARHIVDASYSDFFISNDERQIKLVAKLNPTLTAYTWKDLLRI